MSMAAADVVQPVLAPACSSFRLVRTKVQQDLRRADVLAEAGVNQDRDFRHLT